MNNHNEISSFVWNVCDDVLRGLFKQHEYGDVILPFLVLRRLDCVIEPKKDEIIELYNELKDEVDPTPIIKKQTGLKFFNHSNYDLQRLKGDPNGLKVNFPNYISGFSQNVFEILENFQLEKPVEKLLKNNKLYLLIDKFTEIDLHPNKVDNHTMGQVFEELLRKFSEMSNETSGEHYTPRDVVKLLVSMVFSESEEHLKGDGIIRSIFDPCCGTGGMLTIGKEWIEENIDNKVRLNLQGQELNPHTYSICKSDMLISGEDPDNVKLGSSLSEDHFEGRKFDYMITNPPFGVSWKSEKEFVEEESKNPYGRFSVGTPRVSDGSLLFLQHLISKMKEEGSRIGIVFNGSPLFTGDGGSGESEIRKWIIENDMLECVVSLPDQLFFNTGISTYIWIVTNKKKSQRKGKVQLIDGSTFYKPMKKSLGSKRKKISKDQTESLIQTYHNFEENEFSKIFDNEFFGYTKVTIEQPTIKNDKVVKDTKGNPKPNTKLRDSERIPLTEDIEEYFNREVEPHLPHSWMDREKDKVGYEINFTKYFYQYKPLRSLGDITSDLLELEKESEGIFKEIINE
ncbi:type I restriction enzyme M protein [Polaribacter sp. Hel1_33_78]|uniref:type I restriction-modification system subunit M n=1 Tax=Polaribacter sp. Hel1_33_78 TaxID=1336804 RepID=UPI00087D97FB|nr:class I SAM-dependent DNA methyltransferase [Polaribacter sp. Hel1_33_78]SDT86269.1 type I restriction enzyme M protein [Polaribacter sp. Hel1_33_78]SDU27876.1 type I restriction enzyme M protein [Polaribacter sp. Hel1_33_78]